MKASQDAVARYACRVRRRSPKIPVLRNAVWAFLVGGAICAAGQVILGLLAFRGADLREAATGAAAIMIALGSLLTGLGVYDELGKRAGMGAALPITGFANSIAAPAMEYRREGLVLGVGARLFTIAGPVIVYAVAASLIVSVVRLIVVDLTGG
jgi:stage V sporulation protein AC